MKAAIFHPAAIVAIRSFPAGVRREVGKAIFELQKGVALEMPLSRPMPSIASGVEELRIRDRSGIYRTLVIRDRRGRAGDPRLHQENANHSETRRGIGKETVKGTTP